MSYLTLKNYDNNDKKFFNNLPKIIFEKFVNNNKQEEVHTHKNNITDIEKINNENKPQNIIINNNEKVIFEDTDNKIIINKNEDVKNNLSDPKIWGPSFWFILHNGAFHYPKNASPIIAEQTKYFIRGIPTMLPCKLCSIHAKEHIDNNEHLLDIITSTRDNLFKFYVDFHNQVNIRNGKRTYTNEEIYEMYKNGIITTYNLKA
jgi:hypothetical protein